MDKTGGASIRGNQWQRLLSWKRGKKVTEDGENGVKDEAKPNTNLDQKLKVK